MVVEERFVRLRGGHGDGALYGTLHNSSTGRNKVTLTNIDLFVYLKTRSRTGVWTGTLMAIAKFMAQMVTHRQFSQALERNKRG